MTLKAFLAARNRYESNIVEYMQQLVPYNTAVLTMFR